MALRRRTLLVGLLSAVTGCGSLTDDGPGEATTGTARVDATAPTATPSATTTPRPGAVTVVNDADRDHYVTVAVDDGGEAVFTESRTVRRGTAVALDGRVPTGTYLVVVETASGVRDRFDWTVTPTLPGLRVRVSASVRFSRPALCDPDCALALGGTATGYPAGGFDPRGRRAGSELRVYNAGDRTERVRVRVADGAVLDFRYRVPSTVLVTIPVPQRSGETAVRVDVDGGRVRAFDWAMETDPVRYVMLGG